MLLQNPFPRLRIVTQLKLPRLLTQALGVPAIRAALASVLLWLLAFAYCSQRFWRDPHSAFFQSETVYNFHYSSARQAEGRQYVGLANRSHQTNIVQQPFLKASAQPLLCAAFTTVKRDPTNYLVESIGSLLESLYPEERHALYVYILFANTDPSVHPDWNTSWVANLADAAETYNVSITKMGELKRVEQARNFYVKGVFDYVYSLKRCMDTNAPYILALEDDIIFADGWMSKTLNGLQSLIKTASAESRSKPWLYLRLFYTETSLMWQDTDFWYANMPLAFGLASLSGFTFLLLFRLCLPSSKPHLDVGAIAVMCLITIPAFTALMFMIGKYSLRPLHGVVKMNKYGCCTQAIIYPSTQIPSLIKYLEERHDGQTDSMIEEYADTSGLDRFALAPQVVQHIGLVSSRDNLLINTKSTWAFHFEASDSRKLKAEHLAEFERGIDYWPELDSHN